MTITKASLLKVITKEYQTLMAYVTDWNKKVKEGTQSANDLAEYKECVAEYFPSVSKVYEEQKKLVIEIACEEGIYRLRGMETKLDASFVAKKEKAEPAQKVEKKVTKKAEPTQEEEKPTQKKNVKPVAKEEPAQKKAKKAEPAPEKKAEKAEPAPEKKAKKEEPAQEKKERKAKKAEPAQEKSNEPRVTIASVIREGLKAKLSTDEILENVKEKFPQANTSKACVAWYKSKMNTAGELR